MANIELKEGEGQFVIGVPFACHGSKCDKISEKAGRMLNEIMGKGKLLVKSDDGNGREGFEEKLDEIKGDLPVIEIRSHDDRTMRGEYFVIQEDARRGRKVVHLNEDIFIGEDEFLHETMELVALEIM